MLFMLRVILFEIFMIRNFTTYPMCPQNLISNLTLKDLKIQTKTYLQWQFLHAFYCKMLFSILYYHATRMADITVSITDILKRKGMVWLNGGYFRVQYARRNVVSDVRIKRQIACYRRQAAKLVVFLWRQRALIILNINQFTFKIWF